MVLHYARLECDLHLHWRHLEGHNWKLRVNTSCVDNVHVGEARRSESARARGLTMNNMHHVAMGFLCEAPDHPYHSRPYLGGV